MREWKRERASELGFNDPCVICHNRTLCEIVRSLPETEDQLMAVWGIGRTVSTLTSFWDHSHCEPPTWYMSVLL